MDKIFEKKAAEAFVCGVCGKVKGFVRFIFIAMPFSANTEKSAVVPVCAGCDSARFATATF